MVESLSQIFQRHAVYGKDAGHGDKGSTHSYIDSYESLLEPFRQKADVLEIGLALGWSLDMWGEYFGPESHITGIDISVVFDPARFPKDRFKIIEADATKPSINERLGVSKYDIIIDDGSHMENDQVDTFNILKNRVKPSGLYIIEDILALDHNRQRFMALHNNCQIIDLRKQKGRFDDVLIVYRF